MNGDVALQYIVDFPLGDGPFPTVIYGPGAGDVSAESASVVEHTRELVGLGFAVVRYDKRGIGGSSGTVTTLTTANSEELIRTLAEDMLTVLRAATRIPRVDNARLGLFGVSLANWYAPIVAEMVPDVEWVIVLTGSLLPVGPKNEWNRLVWVEGRDPFAQSTIDEWAKYDGPVGFDQRPTLGELDRPLLYLLGERDPGIPLQLMLPQADTLKAEGVDIVVETFPDGRHLLEGIDFWPTVARWLTRTSSRAP